MEFREEIEKELQVLNLKQLITFSRQCAIRALPFLAVPDNFSNWEEGRKQDFLFRIFYAIDINTYAASTDAASTDAAFAATDAAAAAAVAADAYAYATKVKVKATTTNTNTNAYAAYAAATAVAYATLTASATNATTNATATASSSAAFAVRAAFAANIKADLKAIIKKDIRYIEANKKPEVSSTIYGDLWPKFQKTLDAVGCAYWGKLYQEIFSNNFEFDKLELRRRLNVPNEIRDQGAAAVGQYLEKLKSEGARKLNEARIIILGDKGAGKTCVARKLADPDAAMTTPAESTAGVDTSVWLLEQDEIKVNIWDFAGHTVTHAVHQFFLSERCLYILVYDGRSEKRNQLEYWLNHMKNYGGDSKAIILVNERDQHKVKIRKNSLKEKYSIAGFFSFNVEKDNSQLNDFRSFVADYIKNNPSWKHQEIPTSYHLVKEDLESRFNTMGKGEEHISKQTFLEIAEKHNVEEPETLLRDLHFLGVSLWYKDMDDYDTLILNPEWISQGVYQIINWVSNEKKHSLNLSTFSTVFAENINRYPENKHLFLFNLIKHYELAFEARGNQLIIPHLLEEDQPENLPKFVDEKSLFMRYEADSPLPPNTISRFIVRHNEQIKKESNQLLIWKHGVILDDKKGSLALIREIDRSIHVSVKGNDKTNFLSAIRSSLNSIFDSYESQHPALKYRIIDNKLDPRQNVFVRDKVIFAHHINNRLYFDSDSGQDISLNSTVVNYNITNLNVQSNSLVFNNKTDSLAETEKIKEFKRKKIKRWKILRSLPLLFCVIVIVVGLVIFSSNAGWDYEKAKELFIDWNENFLVYVVMGIMAIIFTYSIKMWYACYFNHSQIENFKKGIEIPEELK